MDLRHSEQADFAVVLAQTEQESFGGVEMMDFAVQHLDIVSYTWTIRGQPVAVAGIHVLWPGVGRAWSVMTPRVFEHSITMVRDVTTFIEAIEVDRSLHRIDMDVLATDTRAARFAQWLGFKQEALMVGYGPAPDRNDYYRFVRHAWRN